MHANSELAAPAPRALRVLLVGASPAGEAALRRVLTSAAGFELAAQPAAPAPLPACRPDVAVVDLGAHGSELAALQALRLQWPELPCVAVCGRAGETRAAAARAQGAHDVIALLPRDLRRLPAALRAAVARQSVEDELRRHVARREAVVAFGNRALAARGLTPVADDAVELVARILGVELSVSVEWLPDGETLRSRAGFGWRAGLVGSTAVDAGARQSHAGHTLDRGGPVVIEDLASETRFAVSPVLRNHAVVSGAAVPIRGEARPFGVLAVYARRAMEFHADDLRFLEVVANTVAVAAERQRAERQGRFLAAIVESSDDAIIGQTLDGTVVSWNSAAERLYGYRAAERIGRGLADLTPPDRRGEEDAMGERLRRGESVRHLETVRLGRGGRRLDVSLTVSPIFDADGRSLGISSIARDIGDTKRTAAALQQYAERLRWLRETDQAILAVESPQAIAAAAVSRLRVMVGAERATVIVPAGPGMTRLLAADGLGAPPILVGQTFPESFFGDLAPLRCGDPLLVDLTPRDGLPPAQATLAAEGLRSLAAVPLVTENELVGAVSIASVQADAFGAEQLEIAREVAHHLGVALRQARLHEQVQHYAAELEHRVQERTRDLATANRELEAFSYSVSHDLRAPLRSLDGFSRALLEDCGAQLDATGRRHLQRILAATRRMAELIDGLLELGRVSRAALARRRVDLTALATGVAAELGQLHPMRRIEVVIAPGMIVDADPVLLRAALYNLLGNAWKYTAHHATARVEVGQTVVDGAPAFFVRDDGAGFDMAYAAKLFGAFQRLHAPGEFEGTGIGLATVQRIIHRHGGRVWAEGAVERGATFWFTLPPEAEGVEP
ncbi:MAG: PAS domain S-box protein [Deltaproteobacteria bacterium]|nr:PAS domain S-box protein [Deltaproteobacteria bacterium]